MRSMQQQFGILGTILVFAYRHREAKKNLCRGDPSQGPPDTDFQPAVRQLKYVFALALQMCTVHNSYALPVTCFLMSPYKSVNITVFNPLTPNDHYSGRTAPLTSKRFILYTRIYSTNIGTEYFKHGIYSPFFLFKMQFVS